MNTVYIMDSCQCSKVIVTQSSQLTKNGIQSIVFTSGNEAHNKHTIQMIYKLLTQKKKLLKLLTTYTTLHVIFLRQVSRIWSTIDIKGIVLQ